MPAAAPNQNLQDVLQLRHQELERARQQEKEINAMVAQVQKVREDIEANLDQLKDLSLALRCRCRRNLGDESMAGYLVWANAHLRVTGALSNGLRRTSSMDRVLKTSQADREENERRTQEEARRLETREHQRVVDQLMLPTTDDFEELFGSPVEEVPHA